MSPVGQRQSRLRERPDVASYPQTKGTPTSDGMSTGKYTRYDISLCTLRLLLYVSLQRRKTLSCSRWKLSPFIATAFEISGLKSAHIHGSKQYIWWSCNNSTFSTVHFDRNPFTCLYEGGKTSLNGFKFGTHTGRFPSDGAASMAVNGLKALFAGHSVYRLSLSKTTFPAQSRHCCSLSRFKTFS